ncbi:MAG: ATP-dependent zinc metalloprotease FtsH [Phycisphaerae bacterium]|nr:ATP-dependent zinc metalloprotease FtsH [Phycisphaerae bacterium]MBT6269369.1 ATP-dependent zinc metalloprotease FtsH [Phycisphaerae bacterium]MBT6282115.1 ATP-dependent zinc metalloprotease FtsH [Phycisphaerae bacterium]
MLWGAINGTGSGKEIPTFDDFLLRAQSHQFVDDNVTMENTKIFATITDGKSTPAGAPDIAAGTEVFCEIVSGEKSYYLKQLKEAEIKVTVNEDSGLFMHFLLSWGPMIFILFLIFFFISRSARGGGAGGMIGNFGKSKHKLAAKGENKVTFDDVAGIVEAKAEVHEIIEFLKNPKKFSRLGGRIPRGILLVGQPGCGKTLLAKAIAGEACVPFFTISGSDFVEMFVGVGASRVRDLFKQAKEASPCIIFLDEIDAVGRKRGSGFSSGGHDEREQTLNAILVEMDGFELSDQVIVMAATNRADVLDPALTRPGRFDRQVQVPLPDVEGRKAILEVHAKKIKLSPTVDLARIARGTPMFSGADLEALINEAAIIATLADKDFVEQLDLDEARDKIRWGRASKSRKVEELERVATAYHEAGHTVVQLVLPHTDPVHKVTIIPRGQSGGATFSLPEKDRYFYNRKFLEASMRVLCGGRIAERRKTNDISSGASMDIQMATSYARHMILDWGMSDRLGFVMYSPDPQREAIFADKDYSPDTARIIDEEIKRLIDSAYAESERILDEHWEQVVAISEALLEYETLQANELEALMRGEKITRTSVGDLLDQEASATPETAPGKDDSEETSSDDALPSPA